MSEAITIPQVIGRFINYHVKRPAGGNLHEIIDDGQVGDEDIRRAHQLCVEARDDIGSDLCRILMGMTVTQRKKVAAIVRGRPHMRWVQSMDGEG